METKETLSAREFCEIMFEGAMTTKEVLQRSIKNTLISTYRLRT